MFDEEELWLRELNFQTGRWLGLSRRILRIAMRMPERRPKKNVSPAVTRVGLAVFSKATKQYRGIVELCSIGRAEEAMVLLRAVFETYLGLEFVLRSRIKIRGKYPSSNLRAHLYVANAVLRWEDFCRQMQSTPRLKRFGKKFAKERSYDLTERTGLMKYIGTDWEERLKKRPKTYSTHNVADFAKLIGREQWYTGVYRLFSRQVHSTDVLDQIDVVDGMPKLRWKCTREEVEAVMSLSTRVFLGCMNRVEHCFDCGIGIRTAIAQLLEELQEIERSSASPVSDQ